MTVTAPWTFDTYVDAAFQPTITGTGLPLNEVVCPACHLLGNANLAVCPNCPS